jgi:hypothetical protein
LDNVNASTGTLEYVKGSHKWSKYKDHLDTNAFHAPNFHYKTSLEQAALVEGLKKEDIEKLIVKVQNGGFLCLVFRWRCQLAELRFTTDHCGMEADQMSPKCGEGQ